MGSLSSLSFATLDLLKFLFSCVQFSARKISLLLHSAVPLSYSVTFSFLIVLLAEAFGSLDSDKLSLRLQPKLMLTLKVLECKVSQAVYNCRPKIDVASFDTFRSLSRCVKNAAVTCPASTFGPTIKLVCVAC